ncbi:inositol monophosphatase [Patescibacteria group bacterium]|nr:inositol monophosphatase [Patescibacteria group bacterium]MBU1931894.1 inositol monophosphatase [Patescibacteria group bacterium]
MNLKKAKKVAEDAVFKAGSFILANQDKVKVKAYKDRQDIVTNIDLQAEKIIIDILVKSFPDHNIISEEKGEIKHNSQYTWYIDPLDGTKEYLRRLPVFNVNISLETVKETLLGVVYAPRFNELFTAVKNTGAFENKQPINVSTQKQLKNAFIYTHLPSYKRPKTGTKKVWDQLVKIANASYRLRSFQADMISLCWVAKGAVDAYIFLLEQEKWWDVAAGLLMVQEAGGKVTDLQGQPIKNCDLSQGILASNGKIHKALLEILN